MATIISIGAAAVPGLSIPLNAALYFSDAGCDGNTTRMPETTWTGPWRAVVQFTVAVALYPNRTCVWCCAGLVSPDVSGRNFAVSMTRSDSGIDSSPSHAAVARSRMDVSVHRVRDLIMFSL